MNHLESKEEKTQSEAKTSASKPIDFGRVRKEIKDEFKCPICLGLYLKPTLFECGHTFCLTCHYNLDKNVETSTFSMPVFKCPLCRTTSTAPWNKRPLNVALDKVCASEYPNERKSLETLEEKCEELTKKLLEEGKIKPKENIVEIYKNANLSKMSCDAQTSLAEKVYAKILPTFVEAAQSGKSHIIIGEKNLVSEIEICILPLAKKLFDQNNVYKVTCTPEECTVMFSNTSRHWGRELNNDNYNNSDAADVNNDNSDTVESRPVFRRASDTWRRRRRPTSIDRIILRDVRSILDETLPVSETI